MGPRVVVDEAQGVYKEGTGSVRGRKIIVYRLDNFLVGRGNPTGRHLKGWGSQFQTRDPVDRRGRVNTQQGGYLGGEEATPRINRPSGFPPSGGRMQEQAGEQREQEGDERGRKGIGEYEISKGLGEGEGGGEFDKFGSCLVPFCQVTEKSKIREIRGKMSCEGSV